MELERSLGNASSSGGGVDGDRVGDDASADGGWGYSGCRDGDY